MFRLPDMHRIADGRADWSHIPSQEWNPYQQRAAATNGIDTPGNRETLKGVIFAGLGLTAIGKDHFLVGGLLLLEGRRRDLQDGKKAEATGTKSPVGEAFDAIADNVVAVAAVPVFRRKDLISAEEAAAMEGIVAAKFVGSGIAKWRHREEHASRPAKVGAFITWIGLGLRVGERVAENAGLKRTAQVLEKTSDMGVRGGIALGGIGSVGYLKTAFWPTRKRNQ